jgi:hypothetical protein
MKYRDAMYAWTGTKGPGSQGPNRGQIEVGPHPDRTGWSKPYSTSLGACILETKKYSEIEQVAQLFIDFQTAVVMYGIHPQDAHREFLKIDEYRKRISPDCPGAEV